MATAYSNEVSVGTYNRIRMRVEYSGTSAHCYMEFRRTSSYTGTWADTQASITLNGTTKSAPYSYSGTVGTDWVQLCNADGFTISTSGGTYNWTFNNPGGSSVLGCSGSITIDAQGTAPTGLSLSNITPGTNQIAATVSVTGWGGLGDANTRFREMSVWEYNGVGGSNRRIQKATGNTLSSTITVTNSSEVTGSLTITPNTRYTLTTFASNGTMYTDQTNVTNTATKATAPTVSVSAYTSTTVTIAYSTSADGGAYTKYIDYSLDGTNWTNGATVSSGSATSGTFTITGLSPKTAYSIRTRVRTTAGNTTGQTLSVTTKVAMYGSVDSKTKLIKKFYGSANALGNPPIKGNTTQQTYTGKNKVGFSDGSGTVGNFTWSIQDGAITLNGTGSGSGTLKVTDTTLFKLVAGTRRLTIVPVSGTWTTGTMGIRPMTSDSSQRGYQQWWGGSPQSNATFTYTETQAEEAVTVDIYVGAGAVFNNYKFYIMWTEGSTDDFDYEPYVGGTPSPNPEYPQAVNAATGEQGVIVAGKNLSPGLSSYAISNYGADSVVKSGNTVTVAVSTSGKGIYFHRVYNASICPQMWQSGYTVSFTISASVPGKVRIGFEQGTIPSYDLTSTPIRVSFTTIVGKNWHIYQDGSTPVTFTISDIQVESGSTATAFSPYAQLYTVNFGGIGKNKFDINSIERGYELLTSGKTSANADWWVSDYIPVKANTAYTSTGVSSNSKCWYDSNKIFISRAAATTATSPARAAYLRVNGTIASITSDPNVQIEEGSSSTTYEAYDFIELCKIDTYQDYVHKSGNDWYIHKEINKITLDGAESWDTISSCFRLRINDMAGEDDQMAVGAVKSNKFTAASYRNVYNGDVDYGIAQRASGASGIAIRNKDISTVADFKTWLETNTPVVYYPLATPTETKITNSTLISQLNALWGATTYGDDTNLTITGEIPAIGTDIFQSTRRIEKFYGSVNNKTKLIYEE